MDDVGFLIKFFMAYAFLGLPFTRLHGSFGSLFKRKKGKKSYLKEKKKEKRKYILSIDKEKYIKSSHTVKWLSVVAFQAASVGGGEQHSPPEDNRLYLSSRTTWLKH